MSHKIIEIDKGWNRILKDHKNLRSIEVGIGLFGNGNSPESNLAYRGVIQELGANIKITSKMRGFLHSIGIHVKSSTKRIIIPRRPFSRNAFDKNENKLKRAVLKWYRDLVDGKINVDRFLKKIGVFHQGHIKKSIQTGSWVRNHPATTARKKSSRPLIDKGEMLRNVKFRIKKGYRR